MKTTIVLALLLSSMAVQAATAIFKREELVTTYSKDLKQQGFWKQCYYKDEKEEIVIKITATERCPMTIEI